MNNTDPLQLIQEYRQRFVGSTAEQIVLDACENAIRSLRAERDEARRDLCDLYVKGQPTSSNMTDKDYAAELGWDCFKEDGK